MADPPERGDASLANRVAGLEDRVARLESAATSVRVDGAGAADRTDAADDARHGPDGPGPPHGPGPDAGTFWALEGLKGRAEEPGAVLFTGAVTLPTGEHYEWQQGHPAAGLLADDWSHGAAALAALAHPVRLLLLGEILHGARTAGELGAHERLGTSGQLYHHLRQLVAAGWLRSTTRGQYTVPGERVVPLLVVLAATR